jgi:hypothetical protein
MLSNVQSMQQTDTNCTEPAAARQEISRALLGVLMIREISVDNILLLGYASLLRDNLQTLQTPGA